MRKLMALVLSFAMVFSTVPAFAAATDTPATDEKTPITGYTVEGVKNEVEYSGKEITFPELVVKEKPEATSPALVLGTDYSVDYLNNTNPGTATVIIKGEGKYTGAVEKTFLIKKTFKGTDDITVTIPEQKVGAAALTGVTVKWGAFTLKEGIDFEITGDTATAGNKKATIKFMGAYGGADITRDFVVKSDLKDISKANMYSAELYVKHVYTGKEQKPALSLEYDGAALVEGTDYTLTYTNNVNAGKAAVTVKGIGAFEGEVTYNFNIEKANLKDTVVTFEQDAYTATGNPIKPKFTVKLGDVEVPATDYDAEFENNVEKGNGTVKITAKTVATASGNFMGTTTATFKIVGKAMADLDVTLDKTEYAYNNGLQIQPVVTVKDGTTTLVKDVDYTVTYGENKYAGKGTVTVVPKGNVYEGSKTVEFVIKGTDAPIFVEKDSYIKYVPTSKPFVLEPKTDGDATGFTFTSSNTDVVTVNANGVVDVIDSGVATIKIATVGTKGSNPATKEIKITVKPLKPVFKLSIPASKQVKVLIDKQPGTTKYIVEYGRMGKYYTKSIKHIDNEFTRTYTTLTKRTPGRTYYIRVKAIKVMEDGTVVEGNWSSRKAIKAK